MSSLKDRMYNYEAPVPGTSWDKIASALDESELQNKYPKRLYNMEVAPPAEVWNRISHSLTNTDEKVTPVRRMSSVVRYAAAAILVGVVAFGINRFAFNRSDNKPYSTTTGLDSKSTNLTAKQPSDADTGNTQAERTPAEEQHNQIGLAEKSSVKSLPAPRKTPKKPVNVVYNQNRQADSEHAQSIYAYADHVPDIADRYVMLMTPDGTIIRMSKKWGNLVCCVSGEEQDPNCLNQIKKWQEKIASSSLAPSPGNFMDILGLVNSLDESNDL